MHDFGLIDGKHPFFAMDFVHGKTLASLIQKDGQLEQAKALPIIFQVCFGLAHAHSMGIVHRDIKPSNIMLCKSDIDGAEVIKIVDFGIAKLTHAQPESESLTRTGEIFGSPLYMSPEQCAGTAIDQRSDVYAVGCVFYEMLTGCPPFYGNSALVTMMQHQNDAPKSLRDASMGKLFPEQLEAIVAKMLAKDPNARYQTMNDVIQDLTAFQHTATAPGARALSPAGKSQTNSNSINVLYIILGMAGAITIAVGTWIAKDMFDKPKAPADAAKTDSYSQQSLFPEIRENASQKNFTSFIKDNNGKTCRRFEFPYLMGEIMISKVPSSKRQAKGVSIFPIDAPISLRVTDISIVASPTFLLRFASDDLEELEISNNLGVSDITVQNLGNLQGLKTFRAEAVSLTDACISELNKLPNLKNLYIGATSVTPDGLCKLKFLRNYSELSLSHILHLNKVFQQLQLSPNLKTLHVTNCNLTDTDMKPIGSMGALETLNLEGNPKITNAGLKSLTTLKKLRLLWISGTAIEPDAIPTFKMFPVLRQVFLYPDHWSANAVKRLKAANPNVEFTVDKGGWDNLTGKKPHVNVEVMKDIIDIHPLEK